MEEGRSLQHWFHNLWQILVLPMRASVPGGFAEHVSHVPASGRLYHMLRPLSITCILILGLSFLLYTERSLRAAVMSYQSPRFST